MLKSLFFTNLVLASLLAGAAAKAATVGAPVSVAQTPELAASANRFGIRADADVATNSYQNDRQTESSYTLRPSYKWNDQLSSSVTVAFTKQHYETQEFLMEDSSVGLTRAKITLMRGLTWSPSVSGIIPTNKKSRVEDSLKWGANLNNALSFEVPGLRDLTFDYTLSLRYRQYEFFTNTVGKPNYPYRISNLLGATYQATKIIDIGLTFNPVTSWTQRTNAAKTSFELTQELGAQVTPEVRLAVGHTNLANAYKENGRDSNISVYNAESSTFYGSLTITL